MEHEGERRRQLELAAYGETTPEDERRAALAELARLNESRHRPDSPTSPPSAAGGGDRGAGESAGDDRSSAASGGSGKDEPTDDDGTVAEAEPAPEAGRRARRDRRILTAGVIVAALVVGGAGGLLGGVLLAGSTSATKTSAAALPTATGDPAATSRLEGGDPASGGDLTSRVQGATDFLAGAHGPSDTYDGPAAASSVFVTASTRLLLTSARGERLYAADSASSSGGFCLVQVPAAADPAQAAASYQCATPKQFEKSGLTVDATGYTATWNGFTVVATVTPSN